MSCEKKGNEREERRGEEKRGGERRGEEGRRVEGRGGERKNLRWWHILVILSKAGAGSVLSSSGSA